MQENESMVIESESHTLDMEQAETGKFIFGYLRAYTLEGRFIIFVLI
jgi:hypothetical protein